MSKTYTITLTDAQNKALEVAAYSPQEWIENFVFERCRIEIEDIFQKEVNRLISSGQSVTGTKDEIVLAADIETAKERHDRILSEQNQ